MKRSTLMLERRQVGVGFNEAQAGRLRFIEADYRHQRMDRISPGNSHGRARHSRTPVPRRLLTLNAVRHIANDKASVRVPWRKRMIDCSLCIPHS
jgi:hypothetical protein